MAAGRLITDEADWFWIGDHVKACIGRPVARRTDGLRKVKLFFIC